MYRFDHGWKRWHEALKARGQEIRMGDGDVPRHLQRARDALFLVADMAIMSGVHPGKVADLCIGFGVEILRQDGMTDLEIAKLLPAYADSQDRGDDLSLDDDDGRDPFPVW
ncbi:hypothetical protein FHP25_13260 [Vineibacter terrae]|uniref:Uncharacterized protein n=1 Tax=Vineibacter terrae TaxID=2586908 RepID=A0A5C8PMJ7_9HYPH|nr:hypothetical protein [Vineibacter terrae]TXL75618.1 hypothetical protein FHP25_13260 [Vineibacter terrae]